MRKQTKIVAVASAAALLAIGASMTAFAATGWVEEDGTWYFYDKDENRVEDQWKRSGDNWYWLDSEDGGAMAVDKLIDDDDDLYYVDNNGVMVRNTWVKIVNEEQDEDDDPAEYNYYYMQSNGKAYKAGDNASTKFRTIDGKRYAFDDDGKMLYGWVDNSGARITDEDGWDASADMYYCGNWDDGAMKTGWQKIYVHDAVEDDDMEHWFYFKSNGKKEYNDDNDEEIKEKRINGKRYGFDDRGVMVYQWTVASDSSLASPDTWKYFNDPEDGARVTKGWFRVVPANEDNDFANAIPNLTEGNTFDFKNADDETEKWYYADGDGNLYHGAIKKIKGKYYAFHPDGWMLSGMVFMSVDKDGNLKIYNDDDDYIDIDSDMLDDIQDLDSSNTEGYNLYYFGNDEVNDGSMKIGSTTVTLDGDSYQFMFSKTGGVEGKGKGLTGMDDNKYVYKFGKKLKASSDDKYIVVYCDGDTGIDGVEVVEVDKKELRNIAYESNNGFGIGEGVGTNKDGDTVQVAGTMSSNFYLLNTSGAVVKTKKAARDGDDWYFYVKDSRIRMYVNNKVLARGTGDNHGTIDDSYNSSTKWGLANPVYEPQISTADLRPTFYD